MKTFNTCLYFQEARENYKEINQITSKLISKVQFLQDPIPKILTKTTPAVRTDKKRECNNKEKCVSTD